MSKADKLAAYFPGLVDVVLDQNREPVFLTKEQGRFGLQEVVTINQNEVTPPGHDHFPFALPQAKAVQRYLDRDDDNLYGDVLTYLQRFSALDEEQWAIVAHYIFLTYLHDHPAIDYCPYILFYAVPERGKSRTGKSVAYVSFRGVHLIELREPNIFRYSQHLRGTLFLDLMDVWKKAESSRCEDILLLRAEKGAKCSRVLYPEKGPFKDTVYYDIYGPTVIASNEPLHKILETRCLPIIMPNRPGNYENPRPELALSLKERLTAWRGRMMDTKLQSLAPVGGLSGRLWDISRPLFQVGQLVNPDACQLLLAALQTIAGERDASKRETVEGRLVAIIKELTGQQGAEQFLEWTIRTADILRAFNENRAEDRHVTPQWVGRKLKSMSLRHRTVRGRSEIILTKPEYRALLEQYGCVEKESSLPPQTLPGKGSENQQDMQLVGSCRVSAESREPTQKNQNNFEDLRETLESQGNLSHQDAARLAARGVQLKKERD